MCSWEVDCMSRNIEKLDPHKRSPFIMRKILILYCNFHCLSVSINPSHFMIFFYRHSRRISDSMEEANGILNRLSTNLRGQETPNSGHLSNCLPTLVSTWPLFACRVFRFLLQSPLEQKKRHGQHLFDDVEQLQRSSLSYRVFLEIF